MSTNTQPGKCIIEECKHKRIYDEKGKKYLPICGYDCFIKGRNRSLF